MPRDPLLLAEMIAAGRRIITLAIDVLVSTARDDVPGLVRTLQAIDGR